MPQKLILYKYKENTGNIFFKLNFNKVAMKSSSLVAIE